MFSPKRSRWPPIFFFFFLFCKSRTFPFCVASFKKICARELLGANVLNLAHLHAFILQCFPNDKNGYLGRLICHIFGISTVIFCISTVNFSPFQGPNRFVALLPQSDKIFQYHNEYHMLSSFVRTSPLSLLVRLQKTLMTLAVYTVNQVILEGFYYGWSHHQELHLPSFH